jgi:hypothetical protein
MSAGDATWRMELARQAAAVYGRNPKVAVFAVAGSVGAGLADEHSDLEIDCYWRDEPSDSDRRGPVDELGGRMEAFWEYDESDEEWSEDFTLAGLGVTISNFLASSPDRWIHAVTVDAGTDPVQHMRLAALIRSAPLVGTEQAAAWKAAASDYPDHLVRAMLGQILDPEALGGWAGRYAAADRGDRIMLYGLLSRATDVAVRAVLAINRTYVPHRRLKWQRALLDGLDVGPEQFAARLDEVFVSPLPAAVAGAEVLLAEVGALARPWVDPTAWLDEVHDRRPIVPAPMREPGPS